MKQIPVKAWLYQMSVPNRGYYPKDFRDEIWDGKIVEWPTGKIYIFEQGDKLEVKPGDVSTGDVIIFFFTKTDNDEPGIYGWGTITNPPDKSDDPVEFVANPPTNYLKNNVIWDPDIEQLMNEIRQMPYTATMWNLNSDKLQRLLTKIWQHLAWW